MYQSLKKLFRSLESRRELKKLKRFSLDDDLASHRLKIAKQRSMGTKIGRKVRLLGRVDSLNPHLVEIGDYVVIGSESILLAHGPGFKGGSVIVGSYTYIGFRVTVLPGVKIGPRCIIGAGAVVTKDVPEGKVVVGNPAKVLRDVSPDEIEDLEHRLKNDLFFGREGKIV